MQILLMIDLAVAVTHHSSSSLTCSYLSIPVHTWLHIHALLPTYLINMLLLQVYNFTLEDGQESTLRLVGDSNKKVSPGISTYTNATEAAASLIPL